MKSAALLLIFSVFAHGYSVATYSDTNCQTVLNANVVSGTSAAQTYTFDNKPMSLNVTYDPSMDSADFHYAIGYSPGAAYSAFSTSLKTSNGWYCWQYWYAYRSSSAYI